MFTRITLVLALLGTSVVAASAASNRHIVPTWNASNAHAQVQSQPNAQSKQSDVQSLYELGARIRRDTFTHD